MITKSGGDLPRNRARYVPGLRAKLWRLLGRTFKRPDWYFRGYRTLIYFVGRGGNDANDGLSWATRKATIADVEQRVDAGDTVYLGNTRQVE